MPDRPTLVRLGKLVLADVAAGRPGTNSQLVSQFLESQPEAVLDLLGMLVGEAETKRPNEKLVTAYVFMFGQALEYVRYAVEGGRAEAAKLVDSVREQILEMGKAGQVEPALLLMILREFASAKLDPGSELRVIMDQAMEGLAASAPGPDGIEAFDSYLEELALAVGGDAFDLFTQVQEMANAFPEDNRAGMTAWLLNSRTAVARETALGWLLDGSSSVRNSAASAIEHAAATGGVSGVMLRRLITLRNWLPDADRMSLDRAIQACRRKNVEISPWPESQVRDVLASGIDGAGAQSIFVLAREGRRNGIACMLLKHGIGIRDAWARHGLTRAELDDFVAQAQQIDLLPCSLDYARIAVAHSLSLNLHSGVMPPFPLLDAMETAGLQGIQPETLSVEAVLSLLESKADPMLLRPEVVSDVLARSRNLPDDFVFMDSWFEADDEVDHLLGAKPLSRAKRIALIRDELLPRRSAKWVERLAWTALTLQHGEEDELWEPFFVSANELEAGRKAVEIPLMVHIAITTVEAYMANKGARRQQVR
jgi:hypothetical protein